VEPRWRHEQQAHAAATVGAGGSKHHGRLAAPGREAAWYPRPGCGLAGHALHITSTGQTQAKVRPTGTAGPEGGGVVGAGAGEGVQPGGQVSAVGAGSASPSRFPDWRCGREFPPLSTGTRQFALMTWALRSGTSGL